MKVAQLQGTTVEVVLDDVYPLSGVIIMAIAKQLKFGKLAQTDRQDWQWLKDVDGRQYWRHAPTGTVAVVYLSDIHPTDADPDEFSILQPGFIEAQGLDDGGRVLSLSVPVTGKKMSRMRVTLAEALWLCSLVSLTICAWDSEGSPEFYSVVQLAN